MAEPLTRKRAASASDWLNPDLPEEKRRRVPRSCEWIISEPAFKQWAEASVTSPVLWIHGPPGCGKSFLAQYIVDNAPSPVVSFFCDEYSSADSILRSILGQLLEQPSFDPSSRSEIARELQGVLEASEVASDTTFQIWDKLAAVSRIAPPFSLVIDGLDELPNEQLEGNNINLSGRLLDLTSRETNHLSLLVSSRVEPNLRRIFASHPTIQITAEKVRRDLTNFIETEVDKYKGLREDREQIMASLLEQSDGIFLWADLSIKVLSLETTRSGIRDRLRSLPRSLDSIYTRLIEQTQASLSEPNLVFRTGVLAWINSALRPLSTAELANVMALEANESSFNPDRLVPDFADKALDTCASLIKLENGRLKALHPSLSDFLHSSEGGQKIIPGLDADQSNTRIATACLTYLSQENIGNLLVDPSVTDNDSISHPFLEYAVLYWPYHLSRAKKSNEDLKALVESFFRSHSAFVWVDRLLPIFLSRSVLPVPPRPSNSARFAFLFANQSRIVNFFEGEKKSQFDQQFSNFLQDTYREALRRSQDESGAESLPALQRTIDLAEIYGWLPGKNEQAQALLEESLQTVSKLENPDSRIMSISLYQALSDIYKRQGKYKDAQALLGRLLNVAKDALSPTDARLMSALDSLGWVYMRLGQLYESAGLLEQALNIAKAHWGSQSPMTLRSKVTLAEVLGKLGRADEAESLCEELKRQVEGAREKGRSLPRDSISLLNTLAAVYAQQQKFDEAADTYGMVVEDRRCMFGPDHPMTLWATMQLGKARESNGEPERALELLTDLVPRQERVLGASHPDTEASTKLLDALRNR